MVGGHDDRGARTIHAGDELPELRVGKRDLGVVGPVWCGGRELRWRRVRQMRIVIVHPQEPRRIRRLRGQPALRRGRDLVAGPLQIRQRNRIGVTHRDPVVVRVEALTEAVAVIEDGARDDCSGAVTGLLETFGNGRRRCRQRTDAVQANAKRAGITTGENRRVRRKGQRGVSGGVAEPDPLLRKTIEAWRMGVAIAITSEPVGAKRVDGDEQDVRPRPRLGVGREKRRQHQQGHGQCERVYSTKHRGIVLRTS